jgi:DNA-directed RNA polymerase sigma subunit (sigma70/sigma32)
MKELLNALYGKDNVKLPKDFVELENLRICLHRALATLDPNEKKVLLLRYGLFGTKKGHVMTLEELSNHIRSRSNSWYGQYVSRSAVARIERNALRRLRHPTRLWDISECLGIRPASWEVKSERKRVWNNIQFEIERLHL